MAIILEIAAVLVSLARWNWIIPSAAEGDPIALRLFETFQALWLSLDLSGAMLFYVAGAIYALGLWRLHRAASVTMAFSVVLFLLGGALSGFVPSVSSVLTSSSIAVYGVAYVALAHLTVALNEGTTSDAVASSYRYQMS